ncbi:hypothetical protein [Helicobacter sp. 23-1045]
MECQNIRAFYAFMGIRWAIRLWVFIPQIWRIATRHGHKVRYPCVDSPKTTKATPQNTSIVSNGTLDSTIFVRIAESKIDSSLRASEAKTTKRLCEAPTHTCKSTIKIKKIDCHDSASQNLAMTDYFLFYPPP